MILYHSGECGTSANRKNPEEMIEVSIMLSFQLLRGRKALEYDRDHGLPPINRLKRLEDQRVNANT